MRRVMLILILFVSCVCSAQVTIDSESARAILKSVQDARLTAEQAKDVCNMAGNQGLVRKENSYGRKATIQNCADALLAVAQGRVPDSAFRFRFETVKPRANEVTALLDRIEANPVLFQQWITQRVGHFSPANSQVAIKGHVVVGGGSGGFAFDQPEFYLNLAYFDEFDTAKVVMAHELYHAVQGVYEVKPKQWWSETDAVKGINGDLARQCSTTYDLFEALYEEGTASYVGNPFLLRDAKDPQAKKMVDEMEDGGAHPQNSMTLLELSVTGLDAPEPVPFEQVYALGFYVPEIEYKLGFLMAKAIATEQGDQAITAFLNQPAYAFTDAYLQLPEYGKDAAHPRLGPNTAVAIKRLQNGCPRPKTRHD